MVASIFKAPVRVSALVLASWLGACNEAPARTTQDGGVEQEQDAQSDADAATGDAGYEQDARLDDDARAALPTGMLLESGALSTTREARSSFGALLVAQHGVDGRVQVESRRDVEGGSVLPWRSRFRVAGYQGDERRFVYEAAVDDLIGDVVVHPSGEITLSVERRGLERGSYELVRLSADGKVLSRAALPALITLPESERFGLPQPLFRMKTYLPDAITAGYVRLLADGEDLIVAVQSYVDVPEGHPLRLRFVMGLMRLTRAQGEYVEQWARLVDGPNAAQPGAWAYDELRWRDQALRPFLARDEESGELLVARAFNQSRCEANVATFADFTAQDCVFRAVNGNENERLPLVVTRFDAQGKRLSTVLIACDDDAAEQVPFALETRHGELVVAGAVVRKVNEDTKRSYEGGSFVDYDGYVAFYDESGALLRHRDLNMGRGDVLAALRFSHDGVVAVGSAGWDRWQGGMSISRGADPWLAWVSNDAQRSSSRVVQLSDGTRHFHLHDVMITDDAVEAVGFSDSPMTHSADGNRDDQRTFGALRLRITAPR